MITLSIDCRECLNYKKEERHIYWNYGSHTQWVMEFSTYEIEFCKEKEKRKYKNIEIGKYKRNKCNWYIDKNTKPITEFIT